MVRYLALCLLSSTLFGATLTHDYLLNGTLADSLGGPSLVSQGGTITASGYTFAAGQGLSLSNAFSNNANYSIVLDFSLTDLSGYRKLIDFVNRTSDSGLYNLGTALDFYPTSGGSAGALTANQLARVVLTRDSSTNTVAGYVNGTAQFSFTDSSSIAVFSAANNIAYFLMDDAVQNAEQSGGTATRIKIFDGALNVDQVALLGGPEGTVPPTGSPEPATCSLLAAGLGGVIYLRRRRA